MSNAVLLKNKEGIHETKRGPWLGTYTGKKFFPLDVQPGDICIEDIAHALSLQCRFAGHTAVHYSVAQHSLLVSQVLSTELKLRGLLHDGSEAYLVDLPKPLKVIADFSAYRRIEKQVQECIYHKYGLATESSYPEVHEADLLLLATEARDLMHRASWAADMPKASFTIMEMEPYEAEKQFLKEFHKLYKVK